jgi:crossover junction endodeoxyribonuclease RuvC
VSYLFRADGVDVKHKSPVLEMWLRAVVTRRRLPVGQSKGDIMICIGIDPGLKGAIACVGGEYPEIWDMPILNGHVNVIFLRNLLQGWEEEYHGIDMVYIEQQQAMPGQGVSSTFKTGANYGALLALLTLLAMPFDIVSPGVWKRTMGLTKDKEVSREKAIHLFPDSTLFFQRKKDEGRAEALLLAEYCRRKMAQFGMQASPQAQTIMIEG